ncbi:hypothetical protein VC83_06506 [Pseudogymnoascus destructans]|uniref:N-acetyltransferase domain-containing protein n=2 Tax=Pseudogymnoascus destructans TaxID=655981 RepID=L8GB21_PSED2|nr:uncharacterized protein VC83_06506 [Pseudogymnoascus destructans]ELR09848.1 hypothetical protein GMDG_04328 [Pseudogymnoascus destructans 20631-21]OAF58280.1 hypothetical protein VC83_06506 [Pseudogymnoascus destructans]
MATPDLPPQTLKIGEYTFTISEGKDEDIPGFVEAFDAAFADNLLFSTMSGTVDRAVLREKDIAFWKGQWTMSGRRHFKVVDEATGKIAAVTRWWFPHTLTSEEVAKAEAAKNGPQPEPVPGTNVGVTEEFVKQLNDYRDKWVTNDDMYMMNILAVVPAYQRLGLGKALLVPVLKMADKEGKKTYIEASEAGEKLYRRLGWVKTGDTLSLDFTKYGAEGRVDLQLMMREPGAGIPL